MNTSRPKGLAPGPEIICLALLVVYCLTALPSFGWRDGPEFANTTHTLGIAHPAGFPTFSLVAKIMTFLPLGSIPFRVTLGVALLAVAALYLLYRLVHLGAGLAGPEAAENQARSWAAAGTALLFGLTPTLWTNATEIEVYSLNLFFLGAVLYCALRWSAGQGEAWLYAGAFLYGLAAGNHGTVAFYVPAFLAYVLLHSRRETWRRFFYLLFFFLVGFSVYLYLPIRSSADPAFDFGSPDTWQRFLMHISDRKDTDSHFAGVREGRRFLDYVWVFLSQTTPKIFWPAGLPLLALGIWRVQKSDRPLVGALAFISLVDIIFFIRYTNPTAFLPAYYFIAFFSGIGAAWLMARLGLFAPDRARTWNGLLTVTLILIFAGGVWLGYPARDRSRNFLPLESFRSDYEAMAPDAISLTGVLWFHHRAYQDIFRLREDVTVISLSDFLFPQWFKPVTQDRFPRAAVPAADPFDRTDQGEFLKKFLAANLDERRDIYWEPFDLKNGVFYPNLKPELELLFKFTFDPVYGLPEQEVQAALGRLRAKLDREIKHEGFFQEEELDAYYILMLFQYAFYLHRQGRPQAAMSLLHLLEDLYGPAGADRMPPLDWARLNANLGILHFTLKQYDQAIKRLETAVKDDPYNYNAWANLGQACLKAGRLGKAKAALERAVKIGPRYPEAVFNLGEYYNKIGQTDLAQQYYRRAYDLTDDPRAKEKITGRLETLKKQSEEKP